MKMWLLLISVYIALLLTACNKLENGTVISKQINEAYFSVILIPQSTTVGGTTITTFTTMPVYYPESYEVVVEGYDNNQKHRIEHIYVDKNEYDTLFKGKFICIKGKCNEPKYIEQ